MEWNNHPFEKDTPVRTFGSRSGLAAWVAKRIGCLYDPLYLSARLESTCRERRTEEERDFPF